MGAEFVTSCLDQNLRNSQDFQNGCYQSDICSILAEIQHKV